MKVLFSILPGTGHLIPVARLAGALRASGHEVAVASAPSFGPEIESFGLTAFAAGPDWLEAEADRTFPGFTEMQGLEQVRTFAELAAAGVVDDLVGIGRRWDPDLVVRETFEWGGWVAAELLDVPHAVISIGIGIPCEIVAPMAGDLLGGLPARYGLDPDPSLRRSERFLYLVAAPASFDPPGMPRGPSHVRVQPLTLEHDPGSAQPPPRGSTDRPLIHATLGTVFNRKLPVLLAIVEALAGTEVDLILSVGRNGPVDELPAAPNVEVERFVSHPDLIPRCDALIFHGGPGTAMSAASAAVPACLLPLSADQPLTSAGYASTGAAINLATEVPPGGAWPIIDPRRVDPGAILAAVRRLISEPQFERAAQRLRAELQALPSPELAAELLERIAETREPVLT